MTAFLDTSILVRYLTGDVPELAEEAAAIVDAEETLQVTGVVIAETAYVLTSVYRVARHLVVDHLVAVLQKGNIKTDGLPKDIVIQALMLCRPSGRVSFADAMVWAAARASHDRVVYSFDERFPGEGIRLRRHHDRPS